MASSEPPDLQLQEAVSNIAGRFDAELLTLITTHHFCHSLLDRFGQANNVSMDNYITMLDRIVRVYYTHRGVDRSEWLAEQQEIIKTSQTLVKRFNPTAQNDSEPFSGQGGTEA